MTTEALPSTETEAPAVEELAPETPSVETPVAETLEAEADEADTALGEYLKNKGIEGDAPAIPAEVPLTPESVEQARQEGRNEVITAGSAERQAALRAQRHQRFQGRANAIRSHFLPIVQGERPLTQQDVESLVVTFNTHHGEGVEIARDEAAVSFIDSLYQAVAEPFSESDRKTLAEKRVNHKSYGDLFTDVITLARKGYVSEKDAKAQTKKELTEYQTFLREKGFLPGSKAPESVEGSSGRTGRWTTKAQARALYVQDKLPGGSQAMRQIDSDPTIPEGL